MSSGSEPLEPKRQMDTSIDVAARIEDLPAAEAAHALAEMSGDQAADVLEALDPNTAANFLAEMDSYSASATVSEMHRAEAAAILGRMDPDDRVDVLRNLSTAQHDGIIAELDAQEAKEVAALESHAHDTAGGLMTTQFTSLLEDLTVDEAIQELRRLSSRNEQLFYSYVVDRRDHLVGVLSMRDLILARPDQRIGDIMIQQVQSLPADMDQEEVARQFKRTNFLAMPVVDTKDRMIGIITVDDVVHVMEAEATEDVQRMFGAGPEERLSSTWFYSFRTRIGWLLVNLVTAFVAGGVVLMFEDTITKLAILAAYMPIVAGTGGNASAQSLAVMVRGLAMNKVDKPLLRSILLKQTLVGLCTGTVIGILTALAVALFHTDERTPMQLAALSGVVAVAILINHTLACTTGAAIPYLMKRFGFDPAQSSSIFATTVTDVAGFFALLGLAYLAMGWLV